MRTFAPSHVLTLALCLWLLLIELGTAAWYRHVESGLTTWPAWQIAWPRENPTCKERAVPDKTASILRFDEAKEATWTGADGTRWQLSWFYWKPGRAAGFLAKSHNPLICMPSAGYEVTSIGSVQVAEVGSIRMPYRVYRFKSDRGGGNVTVLYSRWEDRSKEQSFAVEGLTRYARLRAVWAGRGNFGQRAISLSAWGHDDAQQAQAALVQQLTQLIQPAAPR